MGGNVYADPDTCSLQTSSSVVCSGNQSGGVATGRTLLTDGSTLQSPPVTTINVNSLNATVAPGSGLPGIYLHNEAGNAVAINAGASLVPISITASGDNTAGIAVNGFGTPTQTINFFGLPLPAGAGGTGGDVTVSSHAKIITDGDEAPGISARSRAGGYSDAVVNTYKQLLGTNQGVTFHISTVQGDSTKIGQSVTGSNGGEFILKNNVIGLAPTYTYNLSSMALANLAPGQHIDTSVSYAVTSVIGYAPSNAVLTLRVTRLDDGSLSVLPATYFDVYGRAYEATQAIAYVEGATPFSGQISLAPNFDSYMTRLLEDSAIGGAGGNVSVTTSGSITTKNEVSFGQASYGILAQSKGGTGLPGGGGVFSGDTGNAGSPGGIVTINNAATIHTFGEGAHGIVASSAGGNGGRGGGASFAGNGGAGGTGAKGGEVSVVNFGNITTESTNAFGILAQTLGGQGGQGGGGGWLGGGGGAGGAGTANDLVLVGNAGTITTSGNDSHGILVQSIGGFGGGGGGASGIVALGSDGGNAGTGGIATILNLGKVSTGGWNANALMSQSIGGGGGSAGGAGGLVALGGNGTAGGNGGMSTVYNYGELSAIGIGARGIVAQSIGGGGGHGGDSGGLVAIGGDGATTSDGGAVNVRNEGKITSASNAILAESIGGGGGTGGSSGGWFGVGGSGGGGGDGGTVTVNNSGDLTTAGRNAAALFAQSIGGGGGNGGNVVAVGAFASVAIGGAGGNGGDGDEVVAKNTGGSIETWGVQSHGIFAQSLGGRGGNGGFAAAASAGKGISFSVAIGRTGGGGGDGGEVQVESQSTITTHEQDAYGIYAQSVGGGGGNGGFTIAASAAVQGVAVSFSVGGAGGAAGDGKKVEVGKDAPITGTVTTTGANAYGVVAQSVGGGGGHGGLAVAATISAGTNGSGSLGLSLGGEGGAGGAGGAVVVNSAASISTQGEKAYGIKAQSVGGGGGDGGLAVAGSIGGGSGSLKLDVAVGGSGGAGSMGSTVDVDISGGSIETWGKDAHGVFAQSIGGGGGDGGIAIAGTLGLGGKNANVSVSAGGVGGTGSIGDTVTVSNAGTIKTHGNAAFGIFAQSLGGGGGVGGAAFSGAGNLNIGQEGYNVNIDFAFGGKGGSGNKGGMVDITNSGTIETFGIASHGIFAESIGGGGGQGGSARTMSINAAIMPVSTLGKYASFSLSLGGKGGSGSDGNTVSIDNQESIITHGADSHGVYAQSVGGGGGTGGEGAHGFFGIPALMFDKTPMYQQVSVSMGGSGGAAGSGGAVNVNQHGSITAHEQGSHGIFAQSIGGGGGTGGVGAIGFTGTVGIGGSGGASGNGGKVDVAVEGDINTYGGAGYGVFAQSIGGGGGVGGNIDRGLATSWNVGIGVGVIRNSGNGGNGGEVNVSGTGLIHTRGLGATGIFAQSVGGGGGVAGYQNQSWWGFAGSAGGNGSGDRVTVDWNGSIQTDGDTAHGIYAQSAGGEAVDVVVYDENGNPTQNKLQGYQNLGKDVSVTVRGDVITSGSRSNAIYAQSEGNEGNGNITVRILDKGTVKGGTGVDAAGVHLVGGAQNLIENTGLIGAVEGVSGLAIASDTGNDVVINHGTVTGSVALGTGINVFTNAPGGTFNTGPLVELGAGRQLTNSGTLAPGGTGAVATTTLTGNLLQDSNGSLAVDLSLAGRASDLLSVVGSAQVDGKLSVRPLDTGFARPGTLRSVVLIAGDGVSAANLTLAAPHSLLTSYALIYPSANEIGVTRSVNFAPRSLSPNAQRIGSHLNAIQEAGGSASLAPYIAALFAQPNDASLHTAYEKLGPGALGSITTAATTSSLEFNDAMHSCRQRDGDYRFIREGECSWMRLGGSIRNQERNDQSPGYTQDVVTMAGGIQKEFSRDVHLGFGVSYQHSALNSIFSDIKGERFEGGLILKRRIDATRLSLSFSAGYGHYESKRLVDFATPGVQAQAKPQLWSTSLHGRISHDIMSSESAYVRPMLGMGASYVSRKAYSETGAGGANLQVEKETDTFVSLHPAIEFGGEHGIGDEGTLLRHFVRVGMTRFLGSNDRNFTASMEGAPSGVPAFTVTTQSEKTYADLAVGIDILRNSGTTVRLEYTGQFSKQSSANAIGVKFAMPF
ncbi:MAG: hypothetical protein Q8S26_07570 [Azonexus sp.]|nr:hypothetical protein [Azonexus sp.]